MTIKTGTTLIQTTALPLC